MANTRIDYLYRDSGNYKTYNSIVIAGTLTKEQIDSILSCLDEGEFFLPAQVGFPEERSSDYDPSCDHPWFELNRFGFSETNEPVTSDVSITAAQLPEKFQSMKGKWNDCINADGMEIMPET